jgi:hypothetical protein
MIAEFHYLILIFPIALTLHNLEESLWLPKWSLNAKKYHKPVNKNEFHFALLLITVLAYLISFLLLFFENSLIIKYLYFGFLGAMIINVVFPHLIATIALRKYCPGLITGIMINFPIFTLLIYRAITYDIITFQQQILATVVMTLILILIIPLLFKIGNKLDLD